MFNAPAWMGSLPAQLILIVVVGACVGYTVTRLSVWWGCRPGRKRLRVIEQELAVEKETNGSHVRSLTTMIKNSPRDSGVFRSLDE